MVRLLAVLAVFFAADVHGQRALTGDVLNSVVHLQIEKAYGSAFYLKRGTNLFLVSARHVLCSTTAPPALKFIAPTAIATSYGGSDSLQTNIVHIDLIALQKAKNVRMFADRDLAVLRVGMFTNERLVKFSSGVRQQLPKGSIQTLGDSTNKWKRFDEVFIGNDVYVLGFPNSLGEDDRTQLEYSRPLLRKGCLAGRNTINRTLIIDAAAFKGNSGGPVFEYDVSFMRVEWPLIGVITQFIPFIDHREVNAYSGQVAKRYANSGYAVVEPIDFVFELIDDWEKNQANSQSTSN